MVCSCVFTEIIFSSEVNRRIAVGSQKFDVASIFRVM